MRRTSPFLWLVLGLFAVTAVLLLARSEGSLVTESNTRLFQAIAFALILAFLLIGVIGRGMLGSAVRYGLIWAAIFLVGLAAYAYRDEIGVAAKRILGEVFPGEPALEAAADGRSVTITRAPRDIHFSVIATVQNAPVDMMIDTGASVVTLTYEDALLAGIRTRNLRYDVTVSTANGPARAAPVILDQVAIGPIVERRVAALVAEQGMLETSLLGLNFLNELTSFTVTGNRMIMTR